MAKGLQYLTAAPTFTGKNKEGYYAIYKKNASGFYRLLNGFTIADR